MKRRNGLYERKHFILYNANRQNNFYCQCEAIGKCEEAFEYGVSRNMPTRDVRRFSADKYLNLENLQNHLDKLVPEGTGYRARTRFAKFFNLPELMNMFKEVADIKTSDQLHLPVPEAKFETVVVQPSEYQKDMVASLSERAADVHAGIVDPSVDNMLKITSDGRKLGLDQRLMNTLLPDDPDSKLNACVGNILRIWQDGQADKLTQLVFCDLSTPKMMEPSMSMMMSKPS